MTGMPPRRDPLRGQKTLKVSNFLEEFEKDDIKKNIDIIELFASFNVKLEKKGKSFMGLCPFHEDKNPSLSVDRLAGLYHCFGCGESGDAFDLVEKMKGGAASGFDFKQSLKFLKDWKGGLVASSQSPAVEKESHSGGLTANSQELTANLNTVKNYYHKRLFDAPEAIEYLRNRGLKTPGIYERFQIGFADGSLKLIIGEMQRKDLTDAGILNEKGKEHFLNCIVFPIFNDNNQTIGFYGRSIDDQSPVKHLYLKGDHKGIFNRKASKVYDEIVLTECIIDALSLIETGLENVQSIYGTNGFTNEHLETLKADRVKTVILALDNDPSTSSGQAGAGQAASEKLKEKLINEGFKVKIVSPWQVKDWNEMLVAGILKKEDLLALIEQAAIFEPEKETKDIENGLKITQDGFNTIFTFNDIIYRVSGAKEVFVTSLRVNIKAVLRQAQEPGEEKYFDNLDLYSARSRSNYGLQLSRIFGIEAKRIEKDLITVLEYFEELRDNKRKEKEETRPELTEEERHIALEFLKSPRLFDEIVNDMNVLGYVGEDLNKQLIYLCASSRVLDDPVSILIVSESASGKSMLVETVKKFLPPEDVVAVTSLSDQALNYIKDLTHKFLILGEAVHSDIIEHQIREILSGKELSRLVTVKDEKTGKMESKIVRTPVIVASVMSSTSYSVNPENTSRCFVINTDESREQTRKIHEIQRQKYSLSRHFEKTSVIPEIIRKHQSAQRLLRKILVVNPFGEFLNFPDNLMRTRRDNDRFLDLIACVCFLRQYQKPVRRASQWEGCEARLEAGLTEFIECDIDDYRIAYNIMVNGVLASTMLEMSKSALELYEALRDMAVKSSKKNNLKPNEVNFTQREIRENTGFGQSWIKQNLRALVDFEYVSIQRGGGERTKGFYRIREDEEIRKLNLSMIPAPEEIQEKIKIINLETGQTGQSWSLSSL